MRKMKQITKAVLLVILGLMTITFVCGCADESTPYEINNAEDYTVSVKYDANGGIFTTNTSVIVDSYNISDMEKNSDGQVEIALLSPDNSSRGNDAFKAINNGHFLAGWYTERNEVTDAEGNKSFTFSGKWDFEKDTLKVDPEGEYSSEKPVVTLYAAWVPMFEIEFYSLDSGEYLDSYVFDPTLETEIKVPEWSSETGAIDMYKFPERTGYTFKNAYYDENRLSAVETNTVNHPGTVDYLTGTSKDSVLKLYIDWTEGEWYHIYNTKQFIKNASVNGNYEIHADLDFTGEIWPSSFMYGNFSGVINGNGHTIKNVEFTQTNNSKVNVGLFGNLTDTANISDITFDNVNFIIKAGTRVVGTSYGVFAGTISSNASINNVSILNSTLSIDSACYFGVDDYSVGLVCGMGDSGVIPNAQIKCVTVGDNPEKYVVTVNGNTVTIDEKQSN